MAKPTGVGKLFPKDAHSTFMTLTGSRYEAMDARMERKGLPPLPFSKTQFRSHILEVMGGLEDGFIQCRYCRGFYGIKDISADHSNPLSRDGSSELFNIEYPCKPCNQRKGSMTPDEYLALLSFLETIPLARIDILKRLELSVQLAAGAASTRGVIGDLRKSGAWSAAQAAIRARKKK